jgi:glycosyltransferase involved in cell wall biosynthesis
MLDSIVAQTRKPEEVVLADDGSTSEAAAAVLQAFAAARGGVDRSLLRLPNGGPGAARHAAAEKARGEYLLFVDDDDWLEPDALEKLVRAAEHTGADVLVSAYRRFHGDGAPSPASSSAEAVVPLGPALAAALVYPELGGTVIFVRREAYFAVGGFPRARDCDEDWELLLALVAHGFDLQVVPETLFRYRERDAGRSRADNRFARDLARIRRFERMLPIELRDLAALAYVQLGGASDAAGLRRVDRVRTVLEHAARKKAEAAKKS